jgi:signal transduction histidine kinase/ActR/RegA family two-component response regulator
VKNTKDGRLVHVDARWTLVRDKEGNPKSVLAINSDITERKLLEARVLQAQRMESIGTLAGGIAHDLNNVLAPILLSIEILKSIVPDEEGQELLSMIQTSAEHGANLVKQVLFVGRGAEGQKIQVKVDRLLKDLQQIIRDTFPKNINIGVTVAPSITPVKGDPTHLQQLLLNLCVNARDAMPYGGELQITAADQWVEKGDSEGGSGLYVVIEVADSGMGIPLEIQDRIFEPFYTTKDVGQGTGLGLSTTQAIVKSHHGFIRLSSEEGVGTKFKVYLPADPDLQEAHLLEVDDLKLPRGSGELILVVDDEQAILKVVKSTLEHFGYKVITARNGAEAIYIYSQNLGRIHLVLTDMAMPVMDGPSLIIQLRAINPKVVIIGSSGLTSDGGVVQATGAHVPYFVPKPYSSEQLLKIISKAVADYVS